MKILAAILCALALTGCGTSQQYKAYADAQAATAQAKHQAEAERYKALAAIAHSGSDVARVAAVMSLAGLGSAQPQHAPALTAPVSGSQVALQWANLLLAPLTQAWGISQQVKLGMRQSDNSTALGISNNSAFVGMASKIQAPAASMTLNGTGVLGSGSYEIGPNSGANSGNSGRLAGQGIYDLTHTPTIVTQPAPLVVRPEVVRLEVVTPTATP